MAWLMALGQKEGSLMNYMVVGGAGFIGSSLVRKLIHEETGRIFIYDNFSSGRMEHLKDVADDERLTVIRGDIKDKDAVFRAFENDIDVVYSLASNPDIARAVREPDIDFWEGTYLMNNVLEAMRIHDIKKLLYASGSGVYGDVAEVETDENFSPLRPVSTYGASKLGCEALICSYCHMFHMQSAVFRFANVVGFNQTHGVGFDFVKRLKENPTELRILGDGEQSKSYIYVDDVLEAVRTVEKAGLETFEPYNVATLDRITVTEIANIVIRAMKLGNVKFNYTGGNRGWNGDVPVVRLNSEKIRKLGWNNQYTSAQAMEKAVKTML